MAGTIEKLQTINSLIRTVLALTVFGGVGVAGWYGYTTYNAAEIEGQRKDAALQAKEQELAKTRQQVKVQEQELAAKDTELANKQAKITEQKTQIDTLNQEVVRQKAEIQRLDTALRLHKLQRRLAQIRVLETGTDQARAQVLQDRIRGTERTRRSGWRAETVFPARRDGVRRLLGREIRRPVRRASGLGTRHVNCLFNRIFGDLQTPKDGYTLDEPGKRPGNYTRGGVMSDFEKKIWDDFWTIANDPQQAAQLGILRCTATRCRSKWNRARRTESPCVPRVVRKSPWNETSRRKARTSVFLTRTANSPRISPRDPGNQDGSEKQTREEIAAGAVYLTRTTNSPNTPLKAPKSPRCKRTWSRSRITTLSLRSPDLGRHEPAELAAGDAQRQSLQFRDSDPADVAPPGKRPPVQSAS